MVVELRQTAKAATLFEGWQETLIWSCLEGVMGKIYVDALDSPVSAVALLGDFCFLAGKPDREIILYGAEQEAWEFIIMVPQNEGWAYLVEEYYKEKAKKAVRYAIKKEPDIFDRKKLQAVVDGLPEEYSLKMMDEELFWRCKEIKWCRDWVSQYEDYSIYQKYGLGAVVLKDGEPDGFDIALIKAIGEKLGVEVTVENMEFASLVSSIGSKIDVSIAGMTVTDERKESVDFSEPYYEAVQYVILPADSEAATAADLTGMTIGVQLGTTGDFIATDDVEGSVVQQYNKGVDAVNDLINGRVDCVIIDKNPALVFESKFEGQIKAVDGAQFEFGAEEYAIALPKGDTALAAQINSALEEIKADGTFDELVKTYIEQE